MSFCLESLLVVSWRPSEAITAGPGPTLFPIAQMQQQDAGWEGVPGLGEGGAENGTDGDIHSWILTSVLGHVA